VTPVMAPSAAKPAWRVESVVGMVEVLIATPPIHQN
jgi:hypothetical protein